MSDFLDNIIRPQINEGKAPLPEDFLAGAGAQPKEEQKPAPIFGEMVEVNLKKGSIFKQE